MKQKLSELAQTNIHLRNEKTKYNNQKNRALKFEKLYKEEKQSNLEKDEIIKELKQIQETDKHTIEEYQRMLFHKKSKKWPWKKDDNKNDNEIDKEDELNKEKKKRNKESFQKKIPKDEEITHENEYKIFNCPECWDKLVDLKEYIRFIEDLKNGFVSERRDKTVIKEIIWSWFCKRCRKFRSKKPISKIPITYWENIRMFINFQITIVKMEYSIVKTFLKIIYGIEISEGEIRNILEREALILTPEYERIRKRITSQKWVHFDETSRLVQQNPETKYAWLMIWTETSDALVDLWLSRGWWAVKMLAQDINENEEEAISNTQNSDITKFVWISDWYWWYTNKFENHQLCWAHPNRKLRDLSESKSLEKEKLERCIIAYEKFSKLYFELRNEIKNEEVRIEKWNPSNQNELEKLVNKLMKKFIKITKIHKNDPKKLVTYKESLAKYKEKYFVCILIPWIPADNNKAERALRHIVLKRRTSHWSITNESARFMSINFSVLLSLYWKSHYEFFSNYKIIRDASLLWIDPE
jgi:hypothetical protein